MTTLQYDNELENKKYLYKIYQNSILHDKRKQQIKILKNYQMYVLETIWNAIEWNCTK